MTKIDEIQAVLNQYEGVEIPQELQPLFDAMHAKIRSLEISVKCSERHASFMTSQSQAKDMVIDIMREDHEKLMEKFNNQQMELFAAQYRINNAYVRPDKTSNN